MTPIRKPPVQVYSVHSLLNILYAFVKEVPIKDPEWEKHRECTLEAYHIVKQTLSPLPDDIVPCRFQPIERFVLKHFRELKPRVEK